MPSACHPFESGHGSQLIKHTTMQNLTETQAIELAKSTLKSGFTISFMNANEVEDFVWGYLYDMKLQYNEPIFYVDERGNQSAAIVYEQG